jgi:hypothetical protein
MTREEKQDRIKDNIAIIQSNALNTDNNNCVARVLTYQQAFSIMLRSEQLAREGSLRPHKINAEEKAKQIELCYEQRLRYRPRRNHNKRLDKRRK